MTSTPTAVQYNKDRCRADRHEEPSSDSSGAAECLPIPAPAPGAGRFIAFSIGRISKLTDNCQIDHDDRVTRRADCHIPRRGRAEEAF
ncbi:hypothetical protein EVAR_24877_1 [Eumeta japonica]|uniref:Uncharacterized protein n=1 Tax=Eumeta variegata TaxID=151549 RepID=A0A4C1V558_EUMVA|nr:hypothetical protein EVAR_24877_1 [Eumeta japonica]